DVQQIGYPETQGREFFRELDARLKTLPGVESVGEAFTVPMGVVSAFDLVYVEGKPLEPGKHAPGVEYNVVSPEYFDTLQIPIHQGRSFTLADDEKARKVAIINQTMAKQFWPNEDALGKRFSVSAQAGPYLEVVGVVQDGKYRGPT